MTNYWTHLAVIASLAIGMTAQELPDAPLPATTSVQQPVSYDRQLWIATGINAGAKIADTVETCRNLGQPGGLEHWMPAHSCAGVSAWMAGGMAASMFASWYLNRHGHHKMALAIQYLGAGSNVAGFAYSVSHQDVPGAPSTKVAPR